MMKNITEGTFGKMPNGWSRPVKTELVCSKCLKPARPLDDFDFSECCAAPFLNQHVEPTVRGVINTFHKFAGGGGI